jgi:hypothetical protein
MPLTLISHFWNEEFLLPYWLRHHYEVFDHGVLIDYGSTDRSLDIIREIAPGWEVRRSRNAWFDARDVDLEVMEIERAFSGWKMVLNTTEFVLSQDLGLSVCRMEKYRPDVQGIWPFDLVMVDPLAERDREITAAGLHFQKRWGYHSAGGHSRVLHRLPDGRYDTGRHTTPLVGKVLDDGLFVAWFGWCPIRYLKERKLQIQKRIPDRDRAAGLGRQHLINAAELEAGYLKEAARAYDLWERHPAYREAVRALARKAGYSLPVLKT